jgi:hypothetical protein
LKFQNIKSICAENSYKKIDVEFYNPNKNFEISGCPHEELKSFYKTINSLWTNPSCIDVPLATNDLCLKTYSANNIISSDLFREHKTTVRTFSRKKLGFSPLNTLHLPAPKSPNDEGNRGILSFKNPFEDHSSTRDMSSIWDPPLGIETKKVKLETKRFKDNETKENVKDTLSEINYSKECVKGNNGRLEVLSFKSRFKDHSLKRGISSIWDPPKSENEIEKTTTKDECLTRREDSKDNESDFDEPKSSQRIFKKTPEGISPHKIKRKGYIFYILSIV